MSVKRLHFMMWTWRKNQGGGNKVRRRRTRRMRTSMVVLREYNALSSNEWTIGADRRSSVDDLDIIFKHNLCLINRFWQPNTLPFILRQIILQKPSKYNIFFFYSAYYCLFHSFHLSLCKKLFSFFLFCDAFKFSYAYCIRYYYILRLQTIWIIYFTYINN